MKHFFRKRRVLLLVSGSLTVIWLAFPLGCMVFGIRTTEEAGYTQGRSESGFEVRAYEPLVVAETVVTQEEAPSMREAGNVAFRRLFGYISGKNAGDRKIAMTAPVLADPSKDAKASADGEATTEGKKIAMTAPVFAAKDDDGAPGSTGDSSRAGWRYAFVLPKTYTLDTAPHPSDARVSLRRMPPRRSAVIRFSGTWDEEVVAKKAEALRGWIKDQGLKPVSPPRFAAYDPPFTIPLLRRNEVLIDVE